MRIIGGESRGRRLFAPEGTETRPTADRVRESLFNILSMRVMDARVLDLFSGSGAMALEAVSRGARHAVLVDSSRKAADCIRRNIEAMRVQEKTLLIVSDYHAAMSRLGSVPFDLIFMDPPYRMHESYEEAAQLLVSRGLFTKDTVAVMEHDSGYDLTLSDRFFIYDRRVYGAAAVSFVRLKEE